MATSFNPFGFLPVRKRDGQANTEAFGQIVQPVSNSAYAITALLPKDIYTGDMIVVDTAGTITPLASTSLKPSGVFQGCTYVEDGEPKFSRHWTGALSASDVKLHVITDPSQTYHIQADATLSDGELGIISSYTCTVSSASAGSTITGQSAYRLVAAPVGANVEIGAHARIVGRKMYDGASVGGNVNSTDPYPIVEVWLSGHRSNFIVAQVSTTA
jgi:hypothetical protein|tara:strand:- start:1880 stop:2524 length:645 start_codon:yes stop_codon:yes gene_type:complete